MARKKKRRRFEYPVLAHDFGGHMPDVGDVEAVIKNGKTKYKVRGRWAAYSDVPPQFLPMLERERQFAADLAKEDRDQKLLVQSHARKGSANVAAQPLRAKIEQELRDTPNEPGRNARIAKKYGKTVRTVQRIQREMRQQRN